MIRLFVALPVPPPIAQHLAALIPPGLGGLKPVAPDLMHITLAFIGWSEESRVAQAVQAVEHAATRGRPVDVAVERIGRFPPTGPPRVIWAGTGAEEGILAIGELVRDALSEAAVPFDQKPLRPHITLARVREGVALPDARAIGSAVARARVPSGLRFRAEAIDVMQSTLTPRGPRYSSRASVPLSDG